MSLFTLVLKSFKHYFKGHVTVILGTAITTAIITGALIVGDSVKYSLEQTTHYRLGQISHVINAGERYMTRQLNVRISGETGLNTSAALRLSASGSVQGGKHRLENIQMWGIDPHFDDVLGTSFPYDSIPDDEIIVSRNLAESLMLQEGDLLLLRMTKANIIPLNTPFVADDNLTVSRRFKVFRVAGKKDYGRFNLKTSQTAPYNVFMSIEQLNDLMELNDKANTLLIQAKNTDGEDYSSILRKAVEDEYRPDDAGIKINKLTNQQQYEITSERVFIDDTIAKPVLKNKEAANPILTYFVNEIRNNADYTPYSFVSTLDDQDLQEDEIILNSWSAEDVNARKGDSISLSFYVTGPLRQLTEKTSRFVVKEIVPISGRYGDITLMPEFPGLSDVENCRDWSTGIPIDLSKIRDKDEDYWDDYRGTPKAFINLDKAAQLWQNEYGSYTALRISDENYRLNEIKNELKHSIDPFSLGMTIQPVKEQGLQAARHGVDFSQLFLGLSFFILISGIILTAMLFVFNLEHRYSQIATLSALGYPKKVISKVILSENVMVAFFGSLLGLVLALLYNKLVFMGLNQVWQEIVRTNVLEINIKLFTLIIGFILSMTVSLGTIFMILRGKLRSETVEVQKNISHKSRKWNKHLIRYLIIIFSVAALALVISQIISGDYNEPVPFFMAGTLLLMSVVLYTLFLFDKYDRKVSGSLSILSLSIKNLLRNRMRSLTVILLLGLGTFIIIATGANRKNLFAGANKKSSGTGGFMFYSESTVPVLKNLQNDSIRRTYGLDTGFYMVQFRVHEGDDASCLNLNRVSNPRILGVNPEDLSGRFSFVTKTDQLKENNPWSSLNQEMNEGVVPAIADQTVIKWSLGKKVGDTLVYTNHIGKEIKVKLIGGLAASIFQGNIIISNEYFAKHFPEVDGSNVFLIDGNPEKQQQIRENLTLIFRDYGWRMTLAVQRLAEFMSVTNTYLSIFLVLGAFGLLLGTVGLAIVLARSIYQRSNELALLFATGYSFTNVFRMLFREYFILMMFGIVGGGISAIMAVMPTFLSGQQNLSAGFVLFLISLVILNGVIWIGIISYLRLRKLRIVESLKNE